MSVLFTGVSLDEIVNVTIKVKSICSSSSSSSLWPFSGRGFTGAVKKSFIVCGVSLFSFAFFFFHSYSWLSVEGYLRMMLDSFGDCGGGTPFL